MNWKDILKNVITQGRVKEIEDIDIDIDEDDCRRWLKQLDRIIKSYKPTHKLHKKIRTDGDINVVTEEQACLIKSKLENHDGSAVLGDKVDNAGFFYHSEMLNYVFIIAAVQPEDKEWGIDFTLFENSMKALTSNLIKEFTNPDDTRRWKVSDKEVFNKLISFYEPYARMIKQLSKHCNNRVFFDDYVEYVSKAIGSVLSRTTRRTDGKFKEDSLLGATFKRFGGY